MSEPTVTFQPFDMERMMSKWENIIEYNLSESGVHPYRSSRLTMSWPVA